MKESYSSQSIHTVSTLAYTRTWEQSFTFQGRRLDYNRIPYNNRAERAVEIPLAIDSLLRRRQKLGSFLEIGNVLQHYEGALEGLPDLRRRRIIDKFERGKGVENLDLMQLETTEKFQTIISISTVEHIGQQCTPDGEFGEKFSQVDLEAPLKAIAQIYELLDTTGYALVTVPYGELTAGGWYVQFSAEYLDLLITRYGIPREALGVSYLKQVAREKKWSNPRQLWIEASANHLRKTRYDSLMFGAKAIAVIELTKLPQPFSLNLEVPPTPLVYQTPTALYRLLIFFGGMRRHFLERNLYFFNK